MTPPVVAPTEVQPTAWAVPIGNVGLQSADALALAPDGTSYVIARVPMGCTEVTLPAREHICAGPSVLGLQVLVAHDRDGRLRFVRRIDDDSRWRARDIAMLGDGRLAVLTGPRPRMHDEAPVPAEDDRMRLLFVAGDDGATQQHVDLDLDASPGAEHLLAMPNGDVVVGGPFVGEVRAGARRVQGSREELDWDLFVARFDGHGRARWLATATGDNPGRSGQDSLRALRLRADGNIVAIGGCRGKPLDFSGARLSCGAIDYDDAFVAVWDGDDGGLAWARRLAGTATPSKWTNFGAIPQALATLPDNTVAVGGIFAHTFVVEMYGDDVELHSRGFSDVFIVHFNQAGYPMGAWQIGNAGPDTLGAMAGRGDVLWLAGTVTGDGIDGEWRPSSRFVDHDPARLRDPGHGFIARLDTNTRAHGVVMLEVASPSPIAEVRPEAIAADAEGLRIAGIFSDATAIFPRPGGEPVHIERRVTPEETYDSFLWAGSWALLDPPPR